MRAEPTREAHSEVRGVGRVKADRGGRGAVEILATGHLQVEPATVDHAGECRGAADRVEPQLAGKQRVVVPVVHDALELVAPGPRVIDEAVVAVDEAVGNADGSGWRTDNAEREVLKRVDEVRCRRATHRLVERLGLDDDRRVNGHREVRWWPAKVPTWFVVMRPFRAASSFGLGFAHAVALAFGDDDDGVVQEPVEHGGGGGVLGQEPAPGVEGPVAGDAEGASFVGGGDEPEQQLGAGEVEGREAELVDDDQVGAEQRVDDLGDAVVGEAAVERSRRGRRRRSSGPACPG